MSLRHVFYTVILAAFIASPLMPAPGYAGGDAKDSPEETAKPATIKRLYLPAFSVTVTKQGRAHIMYAYTISLELADMKNAEATVNMIPKIQDAMLSYLVKVSHLAPHLLENQQFIRRKLQPLINETLASTIGDNTINTVFIEKLSKRPV